jgi:hypothetical protein
MKFWAIILITHIGITVLAKNSCNPDEVLAQYYRYEKCLSESSDTKTPSYSGMSCYSFANGSEFFNNSTSNSFFQRRTETVFSEKIPAGPQIPKDISSLSSGQYVEVKLRDGTTVVGQVGGFSYNSIPVYRNEDDSNISYAPNSNGPKVSEAQKVMNQLSRRTKNHLKCRLIHLQNTPLIQT